MEPDNKRFPLRHPQLPDNDESVWNWAQNAQLGARSRVHSPASEAELQTLVANHQGHIRILGRRLAPGRMLNIDHQQDLLLDISQLSGLLASDANSVTFAAATPLSEVYQTLTEMDRMLASSPGVIAIQTLAGALATGTHGQGMQQSSLADEALTIRMVLANGEIAEFDRQHPWFGAVQVGLGTLGIVTAVTLKTLPWQIYTCFKKAVSADTLESDIWHWNKHYALSKAWWFVDDNQMHVWCAREASSKEQQAYRLNHRDPVKQENQDDSLNDTIEQTLEVMHNDTQIRGEGGRQFKTVTRFKDFSDITGDIYQLFCRGIAVPQINVEIAIPLDRTADVIGKIKSWYAENHPHMHYPIILRCTGPSSAWLSPAYQQETCFFGFVVYYADDGTLSPEGCHFLSEVEKLLAAEGGRPHWGKYYHQPLYHWRDCYPQWDAFREVRRQLDPQGKFSNRYLAQLLD